MRVLPGRLAISRSFGDAEAKMKNLGGNPNAVIAVPEIVKFTIKQNSDFILLASDGIFDVMFAPHWKDENSFPNRTLLNKVSEAASISDIDARRNIYKDIQSSVISDFGPVVTVQSQPLISLTNKKVHNWEMNAMNYIFFNSIYKK